MGPRSFNENLGFTQRVKDLTVEQLALHPSIEALAVAVLPWLPISISAVLRSNCFD